MQDDCLFLPGRDKKLGFYYSPGDRARLRKVVYHMGEQSTGPSTKAWFQARLPREQLKLRAHSCLTSPASPSLTTPMHDTHSPSASFPSSPSIQPHHRPSCFSPFLPSQTLPISLPPPPPNPSVLFPVALLGAHSSGHLW